jgi:hypothetical protein
LKDKHTVALRAMAVDVNLVWNCADMRVSQEESPSFPRKRQPQG